MDELVNPILKTEDVVIIEHTNRAMAETRLSLEVFATDYLAPALAKAQIAKTVELNNGDEYLKFRKNNCLQFHRVMNGTTKFPLSWKWSWVNNLPEPYQTDCRRELLALAGVMDVPLPNTDIPTQVDPNNTPQPSRLAHLMREFSEVVAAAAPAGDGVFNELDGKESTQDYANQLVDVSEEVNRELEAIKTATGVVPNRTVSSVH